MLLVTLVLLAGCTASWRAPVETRGRTLSAPARPAVVPRAIPQPVVAADEYRVRRGDTLYQIAWSRGIDYREIARWNGLRPPYRIYAGQVLRLKAVPQRRVPPPPSTPAAPRKTVRPTTPSGVRPSMPKVQRSLAWDWPVRGRIASTFNESDSLRSGIKIAGRAGDRINAAESGKVVYSGSGLIGYGRLIIVKHNDNYLSAYGHNRKILVSEGDQVTKGQKIAEMGATNHGNPLLHFEIRRDGKPVDPMQLLPRR